MDLVHHERVAGRDEPVLEPTARDARGDDHDVPRGRFGRRLALPIHYADLERRLQDGGSDRPDGERLAGARPRYDPEPLPRRREAPDVVAVLPGEQGVDVEAHRQLDGLARRPRGGDDHDAPRGRLGGEECAGVGRKGVVAGDSHGGNID